MDRNRNANAALTGMRELSVARAAPPITANPARKSKANIS
jgi:hypothetical protein